MKSKKVLVVDDEADVLSYLKVFLADNGYEVITAKDGKECFDKANSELPDLITLDISMPYESGLRAFRDLHENNKTKHIPVIIITGVSGELQRFIHSRKNLNPPAGFFEKPINRTELLNKVKELLSEKEKV